MTLSPATEDLLKVGSGIFWSLAYLLIIWRGFKDQTFGMPIVALCANIAWEFIFSFIYPSQSVQRYINITWFALDLLIVFQALRFGPEALRGLVPRGLFYPLFGVCLLLCGVIIVGISQEFQNWNGMYAAFGQNLMMSVLFVFMLWQRNDLHGQSLYIALFKMIGTILPSILFYTRFPNSLLMNTLYIGILIFDALYVVLVYQKHQALGVNPWRRV